LCIIKTWDAGGDRELGHFKIEKNSMTNRFFAHDLLFGDFR
jgi:hypothetical protein